MYASDSFTATPDLLGRTPKSPMTSGNSLNDQVQPQKTVIARARTSTFFGLMIFASMQRLRKCSHTRLLAGEDFLHRPLEREDFLHLPLEREESLLANDDGWRPAHCLANVFLEGNA